MFVFFPLYFSSAIPGPRGAWLRVATSSPPRAHFWPASAGVGRGRARERCCAGDERDRWISPPEHARPRCVDGGPASVQRRFFVIIVFGGALIDHAAGDRDPAWASLGFRGLRRKLSSGSAFPEPPLAGDGLSGPLWVRAAGGDESWAPQCLTSDPSALPVPYQCLTSALPSALPREPYEFTRRAHPMLQINSPA